MKRTGQYQQIATISLLLLCLSLAVTGCSEDKPAEPPPQEKPSPAPEPVVRQWYPTPKHIGQPQVMMPMQQPMTAQPGTVYQPAPAQQQPQVIIVQPGYQPQYMQPPQGQESPWQQPAYPQQVAPQQQYVPQYQPQIQYGQRPWGETGSFGQSGTAQSTTSGPQQTFGMPYGVPQPPAGGVYPGWGVSPPGTFPGSPYPGSVW